MKKFNSKKMDIIVNFAIVLIVGVFFLISFKNQNIETKIVSSESNIFYKGFSENNEVSIMFNVYSSEGLESILDTLKNKNIHCTFFIGGCWADDNLNLLKKIKEDGHEIGNHGYFHKQHSKIPYSKNIDEIKSTNTLIEALIGIKPVLFAPPSGDFSKDTIKAVNDLGMKTIMWTKDTIDWRDHDENLIYNRAIKAKSGDFILMHPTNCTAKALEKILDYFFENKINIIPVGKNLEIAI